jgi:hypothetical protein
MKDGGRGPVGLALDQIFDVGVYIPDVFIVRPDLPTFVTPRLASSRRWVPF